MSMTNAETWLEHTRLKFVYLVKQPLRNFEPWKSWKYKQLRGSWADPSWPPIHNLKKISEKLLVHEINTDEGYCRIGRDFEKTWRLFLFELFRSSHTLWCRGVVVMTATNVIQLSLISGCLEVQTLLAAYWRFAMVRISNNSPGWL